MIVNKLNSIIGRSAVKDKEKAAIAIYNRYKEFTMIPKDVYIQNLYLSEMVKDIPGDIVECGVWRGGMIAGIANVLKDKKRYFLYDSFEGLPESKEIDGQAAKEWQKNKEGEYYFDNCKAEIDFAIKAMDTANVEYKCIKGWFSDTLKDVQEVGQISLLRLDGDWYESTMQCLTGLFDKVSENGIIIIDDYYAWSGCSRAVHDYLSSIKSSSRIHAVEPGIAYIVKTEIKN